MPDSTALMVPTHHLKFLPPELRGRSAPPGEQAVAAMAASLRERGQLQPISVSAADPDGFHTVYLGETRARAALSLKWREIRAEIVEGADDRWIVSAQLAENVVRTPMNPVERWRAMQRLQGLKFTPRAAAAMIGIGEREGKKLARLGKLHPSILAAIEAGDYPAENELRIIAASPLERQAEALKNPGACDIEAPRRSSGRRDHLGGPGKHPLRTPHAAQRRHLPHREFRPGVRGGPVCPGR